MLTDTDEAGLYRARDDIEPDTVAWLSWLSTLTSFHFAGQHGHFTARQEQKQRGQQGYWYAYRKHGKQQIRKYLGITDKLTLPHMESIAKDIEALCTPQTSKGKRGPVRETKGKLRLRIAELERVNVEQRARIEALEAEVVTLRVEKARWIVQSRDVR